MKNFIEVYENALSDELCDSLVDEFDYLEKYQPGYLGQGVTGDSGGTVDLEAKKSTDFSMIRYVDSYHEEWGSSPKFNITGKPYVHVISDIFESVKKVIHKYNITYDFSGEHINKESGIYEQINLPEKDSFEYTGSRLKPLSSILMKKYKKGLGGYNAWHADFNYFTREGENPDEKRTHVIMFYLNDVEEGGETELYHQKLKIKPKQGSMVIFPCYFTHTHKGHIPISNDKYIMNIWMTINDVTFNG